MIRRWKAYRTLSRRDGVEPLGYFEYAASQAAAALIAWTAARALKRGDNTAYNQALLTIWAGNDSSTAARLAGSLPPKALARATRQNRINISVTAPEPGQE